VLGRFGQEDISQNLVETSGCDNITVTQINAKTLPQIYKLKNLVGFKFLWMVIYEEVIATFTIFYTCMFFMF